MSERSSYELMGVPRVMASKGRQGCCNLGAEVKLDTIVFGSIHERTKQNVLGKMVKMEKLPERHKLPERRLNVER